MVHSDSRFEAISEQIEIFCFLGLKLTRGFFKDFRDIRADGSTEKIKKLKKFYKIFVVVYFSLKEAAFLGGVYTSICVTHFDL